MENVARAALLSISSRNTDFRETLRGAIFENLGFASDTVIGYSAKAIKDWIGPDLAQLNDFKTLFQLLSHRDRRIQNGVLYAISQRIKNEKNHDALERAGVVSVIQSLANSNNNEGISFVALALHSLALTLARNGHVSDILRLLASEVPKIREGASTAIQVIANSSEHDRKSLLDDDILERLTRDEGGTGQATLELSSKIIMKLAFDYVRAGKVNFILTLVEYVFQFLHIALLIGI